MITEQDLMAAIAECQGQRNPTANTCIKLASYYTILNQMKEREKMNTERPVEIPSYSFASSEPTPGSVEYESDSEFGKVIHGKDQKDVLEVMDELMTTLKEMIPRLYHGVMDRLQ